MVSVLQGTAAAEHAGGEAEAEAEAAAAASAAAAQADSGQNCRGPF